MRVARYALLCPLSFALVLAGCATAGAPTGPSASTPSSASAHPPPSATSSPASTATTQSGATTSTATRTSAPGTPATAHRAAPTRTAAAATPAALSPVPTSRGAAGPAVRFPQNEPAVGPGANATIGSLPDAQWGRMVGYSWTAGCPVGRSQLRYVQVNFWGFDGKRSRGALVVNASIADEAAAAFTRLYALQFRIRQMRPMDSRWGRNPKGPGANDYAAMEADNTSAFNCRYVGGQEASKVYSRHAHGTAIDVNDFENPYVDDYGTVYPDTYYVHRRGPAPGVFSSGSSAAVRAFTSQGLGWGGLWGHPDYQHFDR